HFKTRNMSGMTSALQSRSKARADAFTVRCRAEGCRTLIRLSLSSDSTPPALELAGVFDLGPGVTEAVVEAMLWRPGLNITGRRGSGPGWSNAEPHPTLMRTPAAPPRKVGRLCRRLGDNAPAGPDTYTFPAPWPFKVSSGSPPERGVQFGRAHGRGGSS